MKTFLLLFSLITSFQNELQEGKTYIRIKNETTVPLKNIELHNGSENKIVKIPYLSPEGPFSAYIKVKATYKYPIIFAKPHQSFLVGENRTLGEKLPPGKYTYILFMKDLSRNLLGIKLQKDN